MIIRIVFYSFFLLAVTPDARAGLFEKIKGIFSAKTVRDRQDVASLITSLIERKIYIGDEITGQDCPKGFKSEKGWEEYPFPSYKWLKCIAESPNEPIREMKLDGGAHVASLDIKFSLPSQCSSSLVKELLSRLTIKNVEGGSITVQGEAESEDARITMDCVTQTNKFELGIQAKSSWITTNGAACKMAQLSRDPIENALNGIFSGATGNVKGCRITNGVATALYLWMVAGDGHEGSALDRANKGWEMEIGSFVPTIKMQSANYSERNKKIVEAILNKEQYVKLLLGNRAHNSNSKNSTK